MVNENVQSKQKIQVDLEWWLYEYLLLMMSDLGNIEIKCSVVTIQILKRKKDKTQE